MQYGYAKQGDRILHAIVGSKSACGLRNVYVIQNGEEHAAKMPTCKRCFKQPRNRKER